MEVFNKYSFIISLMCCIALFFPLKKSSKFDIESFINKNYKIILLFIFIIGSAVRFYKLTELPFGLHIDEYAMAYDAFALSNFGMDRHLMSYPVYLINFGGGQSALMAYLVGVFYKIFGDGNIFAIRLPAAAMGALSILIVYYVGKNTFDKTTGIISAFFMAVFPSCIMMSRFGLDCYLMYSFCMLAVASLIFAVTKQKTVYYFISGFFFGISLYTYAIAYIFVPVVILISVIYLMAYKKLNIKQLFAMGGSTFVMAFPLMAMMAVNNGIIAPFNLGPLTITVLPEFRGSDISFENIKYIKDSLSSILVFDGWEYNSDPVFNTTYLFTLPLIFCGMILAFKDFILKIYKKEFSFNFMNIAYLLGSFLCICLVSSVNVNKLNVIYPLLAIFAGLCVTKIMRRSNLVFILVFTISCFAFGKFTNYYFGPDSYRNRPPLFGGEMRQVVEFVEENFPGRYTYICDSQSETKYPGLALATMSSPEKYNEFDGTESIDEYHLKLPVYFDNEGNLTEEFYEDCVYAIEKIDKRETYEYIRDKLTEKGFSKKETKYYDIYYNK